MSNKILLGEKRKYASNKNTVMLTFTEIHPSSGWKGNSFVHYAICALKKFSFVLWTGVIVKVRMHFCFYQNLLFYIYLNLFSYAFYAVHLMMETSICWALYYDANTSYLMPHADWLEQKIRATCRIRSKQILELSVYTKFTVVWIMYLMLCDNR